METQAELANFTSSDHLAAALKQVIHGQYASLSLNPDIARICECAAVAPVKYTGRFAQALQLHEQFRQYSDLEAAQECINIYKALLGKPENYLDIPAVEHRLSPRPATTLCARPKRCHILIHLAHIFEDRFRHAENPSDLDFAIEYGRDALLLCGAEQLVCPTVSVLYANIMILCADNASNLDWIAMAEILCRGTILICSTKHPLKATALSYLGWILFRRFWVTGSAASLDEAIKQQRLALTELHPSQALEKHRHLRYLGSYLFRQYEALNDPGVLEESLTFTAEALRHCTTTHIDRSKSVHDMLRAIVRKCMHSHSLEDLDHGVNIGRAALQSRYSHGTPPVHMLEMVANILSLRHQLNPSDGHDIDEAVHLYREIMKRSPQSSIESHGRHLDQIALALYLQYGWTGDLCNLDEAVHLFRRAADASQGYFHLLSARRVVSSLAEALMCRFAEIGNIEDLNEALDWDMRALAGSPSESDYSGMALLKVSHLCTRYEVLQDMADLNEAVELSRSLLNLLSPNHVYRVEITHYMTKALLLRGRDTNNTSDITMVIQELTPMIEILSSMHHGPETFRILALGHQIRFRQTRDPDEAIRALEVMHAMLALAPPGRRYRHQCLISSAELYLEHGTSYRDLALALTRLQDALSDNHRDVRSRIQGTMSVLSIIELSHKDIFTVEHTIQEQLLDVYNSIVSLLPRVAFFGLHLRTRLTSLRVGQAVALTGASHALNLSFPEKSLEILEQGRAVFWTHSLRLRSPFDSVPSELRDRLLFLARKLEQTSPSGQDSREMESEAARRRQQSEDFNALLEEVRMLPGFDRFLLPDQCSTLMKAAENGPVVVLLSSRLACHAIIIKPSQDLMSIPLKELTEEWLVASCTSWRSAATEARSKLKERLQVSKSAKRPKSKHTQC